MRDMKAKSKYLKEVHLLVQEVINQPIHLSPYSDKIWPGFVHLLSNEGQVMIGCDDHSLYVQDVSFHIKKASSHLEFICRSN